MADDLITEFASADRLPDEQIRIQAARVKAEPLIFQILDAIPDIILILNSQRQTVFANKALVAGSDNRLDRLLGFRPGELLDCQHAFEAKGGCGTTKFCSVCGAVRAILASQKGYHEDQECRISLRNGDALDLRVWASPIEIEGEPFTVFKLTDISHEKRRAALERIFFHDILNTTTSLIYTSKMLQDAEPDELNDLVKMVNRIAATLNDEIQAQRTLSAAEDNQLAILVELVEVHYLLLEVAELYASNNLTKGRKIEIDADCAAVTITTDRVLLRRVVSNMVKNALEGCPAGSTVTLGCELAGEAVKIWVHNPGYMTREVQLQIFQRSFSTKGPGRGLGTYAIKLLTERYLKGKTTFSSSPENGIKFVVTLPLQYDA